MGGAQDKVASVLDAGDSVVEGLEGTIDSLNDIVHLLQTDINITNLRQDVQVTNPLHTCGSCDRSFSQCIDSFLTEMPDPASLRTSILSLDTILSATLTAELDLFTTRLNALRTGALGDISGSIDTVRASENWFHDFENEIRGVNDAIDDLPG